MAIYIEGIGGDDLPINEDIVKEYIDTEIQGLLSGTPAVLDTLKELADAVNNDPNFATTLLAAMQGKLNLTGGIMTGQITLPTNPTLPLHAATKQYVDTSIANLPDPVLTLDGLTDVFVSNAATGQVLAFNGTYWYPTTIDAADSTIITNAAVNAQGRLIITMTDGSTIDAGSVVGPQGIQGLQGPQGLAGAAGAQGPAGVNGVDGVGFASAVVDINGNLILTKTDGSSVNVGPVKGAQGAQGPAGAQGAQGLQGVGVTAAVVNSSGNLVLTLSNGSTINAGSSVGPQGPQGIKGDTGAQGPIGLTGPAGAQGPKGDTGAQGPIGLTGPAGTSYSLNGLASQVQVYGLSSTTQPGFNLEVDLANKANRLTTARNITLSGKVTGLTSFDGSNNVTMLTSLNGVTTNDVSEGVNQYFTQARARTALSGGTGISYNSGTGVVSLNANTDQVAEGATNLYYTNNRFDNRLAQSNLAALADVANVTPSAGQALVWNGNTWAPATVNLGGSGGTGTGGNSGLYKATVQVDYDASGNLSSVSVLDGGISAVIATATSTVATVTFTFLGSSSAPAGIQVYGYQRTNNVYVTRSLASDFPTRTIAAGGTSGNPTGFTSFEASNNTMTLGLTRAATGATAAIGQTTHCVIQFLLSSV